MSNADDRKNILENTAAVLIKSVDAHKFVDVGGRGAAERLGISQHKLHRALAMLKEEGFEIHMVQVQQKDMPPEMGMKTILKVLAPPGTTWRDVNAQKHMISQIDPRNEEDE